MKLKFVVTLDKEYESILGGRWGMLGKSEDTLIPVTRNPAEFSTVIERIDGLSDFRGTAIIGKKGDRFVYFGLDVDGHWLRRWKLRHQQLESIFDNDLVSDATVAVYLGKSVTPTMANVD